MITRFRRETETLLKLKKNRRVVLAVSGGSDSTALLHLVLKSGWIPRSNCLTAHFDHALRRESAQEALFVQRMAKDLGVPFLVERWTQRPKNGNLPEMARKSRYAFLTDAAHQFKAGLILTGHHRNDQAETFLAHLMRGSALRGLGAMPTVRKLTDNGLALYRPLLIFRKDEITAWLKRETIPWLEDPGNSDPVYQRSRIRHTLMPFLELEKFITKNPADHLTETAVRLQRADAALDWMVDQIWPTLCHKQNRDKSHELNFHALTALPDEVICRVLIRLHQQITQHHHAPSFKALEGVLHHMRKCRRHWSMRIHGLSIHREEDRLRIAPATNAPRAS